MNGERFKMSVNAILAVDGNLGIGYNGKMPWPYNKKDMEWFKDNTERQVVIMGRKTWESLSNKKLPERINVVVTNSKIKGNPDYVESGDIKALIEKFEELYPDLDIFVIGGANLYRQALPYCDRLYITRIKKSYKCDTFMYSQDFNGFNILEYIDEDENMSIQIRGRE